ncbi:MAG: class I SAM-dependent methyltransferase [Ruminococcus sp.]|nr:class I SAM-dependent methyltransferase [Ruminococcus sp.]
MADFWDRFAFTYDLSQLLNKRVNGVIAAKTAAEISEGDYVLDCAAGTGMLSIAAAEKAGRVLCSDFSKKMLMQSMKNAKRAGICNISFARRDITSLKDGDNKFDAVIAGNVLHLLDDPEKAVTELIRVTKKGGRVILPTYLNGNVSGIGKAVMAVYRLAGFDPKHSFDYGGYCRFIADTADKCGCGYRAEMIKGGFPAAFAVITKGKGG